MKSKATNEADLDADLMALPDHLFCAQAREKLLLTRSALASLLGVMENTVKRWERDPTFHTSRQLDPTAKKVLVWMMQAGRPADWPLPPPG